MLLVCFIPRTIIDTLMNSMIAMDTDLKPEGTYILVIVTTLEECFFSSLSTKGLIIILLLPNAGSLTSLMPIWRKEDTLCFRGRRLYQLGAG